MWTFEAPDDAIVVEGPPAEQIRPPLADPLFALKQAMNEPLGMKSLEEMVDGSSRVVIALNDWMGGSYYAAPVVLDLLKKAGVKEKNIRMIVAGGTHAKVTRKQLLVSNMGRWATGNKPPFREAFRILSPAIVEEWSGPGHDRIERHDSADPDAVVDLGLSRLGDLVEVNRILTECDLMIYLGWGPVPLSPWGGFLGSGVALGFSSARAILSHHSPQMVHHREGLHSDPKRQLYARHKVAIMEKIEESVPAKIFMIDPYFNVHAKFAGRWWVGHWRNLREAQLTYASREFVVRIPRAADIVVLGSPAYMLHGPTSNPIIAMAHIANTLRGFLPPHPVLRKGGVVIMTTPCDGTYDERYRPSDREVLGLYARVGRNVEELFDQYAQEFLTRPDYIYKYRFCYGHHPIHPFWLLASEQYVFDQTARVIFVGAKESEAIRQLGVTVVPDLKKAWELAVAEVGKDHPDVTVLPNTSKRLGVIFEIAAA